MDADAIRLTLPLFHGLQLDTSFDRFSCAIQEKVGPIQIEDLFNPPFSGDVCLRPKETSLPWTLSIDMPAGQRLISSSQTLALLQMKMGQNGGMFQRSEGNMVATKSERRLLIAQRGIGIPNRSVRSRHRCRHENGETECYQTERQK